MAREDREDRASMKCHENCHSYCPYGKQCRYHNGDIGLVPEECSMFYKLEDIINDAKTEEKERAFEEVDDW